MRDRTRNDSAKKLIWAVVALVALLAVFSATAVATDASQFCPTCHEMKPHYAAWQTGPHKDVPCIDCHVGQGMPRRFAHKFVALGEVVAHVAGQTDFPMPAPADVPDARCVTCHESVTTTGLPQAFDHAKHASYDRCQQCHATTGHDVSTQALVDAGVYSPQNAELRASADGNRDAVAVAGRGAANLAGHQRVVCDGCHDMAKTGCAKCHALPAKHRFKGDCANCHRPGAGFKFAHSNNGDCTDCHKAPGGKHPEGSDCQACHRKPGSSWAFRHSGNTGEHSFRSFACAKCHPVDYRSATCTCHKNGVPKD